MNSLAHLQRALQAHVLEGRNDIADAIDESPSIPASTRLGVYSDAYRLRLIEALESNFPVLAKLLGTEGFSRMAQQYCVTHPSRHFSIRWFGHQLADFLTVFPDYREQPWFAELASWEWRVAAAFDAADASLLTIDHLGGIAPEEWPALRFIPHPSLRRLALTTNVAAIVKAAANDESLPTPQLLNHRVEWMIWRKELLVQYRSLAAPEATALDALIKGEDFESICERLTEFYDGESIPLHAATLLKTWTVDQCLQAPTD